MTLKVPNLTPQTERHEVLRGEIFDVLPGVQADLAYLDPPYGSNNDKMPPSRVRYGAYYHLWTTVCRFDAPELFGKANRRADSSDGERPSVFEEFRRSESGRFVAAEAIERLLKRVPAPFVLLSYGSGGRATSEELREAIEGVGKLREAVEIDYKRNVMGSMRWTHEWVKEADAPNREFLFLIEK
jgi:adenine-specific DNA-methyltransferase